MKAPILTDYANLVHGKVSDMIAAAVKAASDSGTAVYVSTKLNVVVMPVGAGDPGASHVSDFIVQDGVKYHILSPPLWAWILGKYRALAAATDQGRILEATFSLVLNRTAVVYDYALAIFGNLVLVGAVKSLDIRVLNQFFAADIMPASKRGPRRAVTPTCNNGGQQPVAVPNSAVQSVAAIEQNALALGWTAEQLWRRDGIMGCDWGLICCLHPGCRIGGVTATAIEVIQPDGKTLKFYNDAAPQPWKKKAAKMA